MPTEVDPYGSILYKNYILLYAYIVYRFTDWDKYGADVVGKIVGFGARYFIFYSDSEHVLISLSKRSKQK